jgi:hypothetical protein
MTNRVPQHRSSLPSRGARIGIVVGCCSWAIALAVLCAATGRFDALLSAAAPAALASLAVAALLLLVVELAARVAMRSDSAVDLQTRTGITLGACWIACGLLALIAEALVVPLLAEDASLAQSVRASGGALSLPRWMPMALLAIGSWSVFRALRAIARVQPSDQVPTNRCAT